MTSSKTWLLALDEDALFDDEDDTDDEPDAETELAAEDATYEDGPEAGSDEVETSSLLLMALL